MNPRMMVGEPAVPVPGFIQIDALCDRFEGECRAGRNPDLAVPGASLQVNRRVPRDLEVICLKCLEKEPARRYPEPWRWPTIFCAGFEASPSSAGP